MASLPPLALYVHLPWCERKCPYCDFNSHEPTAALPTAAYVAALLADLDAELARPARIPRPLRSVFIGGGTPSLFPAEDIARLLDGVRARLPLHPQLEVTMEANPGSAEQARFAGYRAAGVNRLSLGIQSFDDAMLQRLGRVHDSREAHAAIAAARAAGFDNLNLDLMHGLPGQDAAGAAADLTAALAHGPEHLSWYQLTIEPNTAFHKRPPVLPVERELGAIEAAGMAALADAGFRRYEVSAWARGPRSVHNLNYWGFGDYLGIGAGAHGKLSWRTGDALQVLRTRKTRTPADYLADEHRQVLETRVAAAEQPGEFAMNALRLVQGVPEALLASRTSGATGPFQEALVDLRRRGLLREDRLACTPLGYGWLDSVVAELL